MEGDSGKQRGRVRRGSVGPSDGASREGVGTAPGDQRPDAALGGLDLASQPARVANRGNGYTVRIADLPALQRPRERLSDYGPGALSTAELLAIVLGSGTQGLSALDLGSLIIAEMGSLSGVQQATLEELQRINAVGPVKAAQIKAALELGRRLTTEQPDSARLIVRSPLDVAMLWMSEMGLLEQEELRVILLNTRNEIVKRATVYRGSVNSAQVRPAEVLREAVRANLPSMVVVHNHPSGDPSPSPDDIALTRRLVEGSELLSIDFLDHIVIGRGRFLSMREQKLGFAG
ncbi:MAG TPA: DNA repair protein RadC [Dehalococcoidia bacterium]|nr:DNA repair protein RadC [Dehalococcoidia bacterium]